MGCFIAIWASASGRHLEALHTTEKTFFFPEDSTGRDTLHFPIRSRRGNLLDPQRREMDLSNPFQKRDSLYYDPETKEYRLQNRYSAPAFRNSTPYSRSELSRIRNLQQEDNYWTRRRNLHSDFNLNTGRPNLYRGPQLYNRIFGGAGAEIDPQGNLGITLGYERQMINNPILPERARRPPGGLDFDMDIDMNIQGNIGSKLQLTSTYNTRSTFDFDKQIKLEYTGDRNSIIQKVEAGNVSFPLRSQLITGIQSLFGIKTRLKFGRLAVTGVFTTQKSNKKNIVLESGVETRPFDIQADRYEENQHFFLGHFFRNAYNEAMSTLPHINSQAHITRIQVWVTNKRRATVETRDVVGLMDLGEEEPYNSNVHSLTNELFTQNGANDLYRQVTTGSGTRNSGTVISRLQALGLNPVRDFEKTHAIMLDSNEYTVNRELGFISLNRTLQPDEVLAVAFQYTYNGKVFQVGEFGNDVPPAGNIAQPQILFLKLLKATSARPNLPIWKLMMKNIYSLGSSQINRDGFRLDIFYQDPGGGDKRYLPEATGSSEGEPLLSILSLDRLNSQNDPQPDGVFDYVEGFTINSRRGKIIFPVLEPFGNALDKAFGNDASLAEKYKYQILYDSTITTARQFPQFNRFVIRGSFKSKSSSEISLGGFNIPEGSVTITAGGQRLIENVDYVINYSLGSVRITNDAILSSGLPVNVRFEDNATFGQQTRNYFGLRLDYTVSNHLTLGGSAIRMTEKPYFNIVDYNQDPISNTIAGLDVNYRSDLPGLTRWLDKLPNYNTEATSAITATGEVARLMPGHSKLIGKGEKGVIYLDDFEGASNAFDLRYPFNSWHLASTPQGSTDENNNILFPEATLHDSLDYGFKRAQLAWYTIEPELVDGGRRTPKHLMSDARSRLGHYVRLVKQQEVFPQKSVDFGRSYLNTLDLAFYPTEKGPYNFLTDPTKIDADGLLQNPQENWGGIMRALENTDFEASNVEYLEFWIMDPFLERNTPNDGYLYINLGNVSEDILKDGQMSFENGLPSPDDLNRTDSSVWGRVPRFQEQITNAFDNNPEARAYQDVGYDGMSTEQERDFHTAYLQALQQAFGTGSKIYRDALEDPSNDDYHYYRGEDLDEKEVGVLGRYKRFNAPEGNSPVSTSNTSSAASNVPETEDINRDNTLNETEEYFQYRIPLKQFMDVGDDYIVDKMTIAPNEKDGPLAPETWYQFRVPISKWDKKVGSISDFKSIRFMRMFLTGFQDSVILRFGKLGLVRNQWRTYLYHLDTSGIQIPVNPDQDGDIAVSSVNVEENATRTPIPYVIPPGIQRQSMLTENNVNRFLNEQSLSLEIKDLRDGKARAVFKEMSADLRRFGRLQLFIHAEELEGPSGTRLKDGELQAVIRLGSDFISNYYEYRIPLKITDPNGNLDVNTIWPLENQLDLDLSIFPQLKIERNQEGASVSQPYTIQDEKGNYLSVVGNPSMGDVREFLLGVLNPTADQSDYADDGLSKSAVVWFDELRVSNMDESGGYAATGQVNLRLADLGRISLAGTMHSAGFGNIDQRINDRFKDDYYQYDVSTNLELGRLLPEDWRLSIPVYAGYSQTISNPEYDPYDLDIKLNDKLNLAKSKRERDSILRQAQDFTSITSLNFTNVGMLPNPNSNHPWAFSNFRFNYSHSRILSHNPLIDKDILTRNRFGIDYQFNGENKFVAPFRNLVGSSPYLALIRDFNVNFIPSLVSIRGEIDRQFGETMVRNIGGGTFSIPSTFDKQFSFDRYYNLRWDLTQSLNVDFQAVNNSRIDEPFGRLDTKSKKDSVWNNLIGFGRPTFFRQNASVSYTLPLQKFPLLDWMNVNLNYTGRYSWTTASLLTPYLGNIIENGNQKQLNANLDFTQLYRKSKFLQQIIRPSRSRSRNADDAQVNEGLSLTKILLTPLLMIRRAAFKYSENSSTTLPGYLTSIGFMGQNWKAQKPGVKFALGWQPDETWLDHIGSQGWLTSDSSFNIQYRQQFIQQFDIQGTLQPLPDLVIDVSMHKSFSKNHSELFKDLSGTGNFEHLNPYDAGGFEVSYFSLKTLFDKTDKENGISDTYKRFESFRRTISERLGKLNPYTDGTADPEDPAYMKGYGKYANDVLIPSFLAAYSGKDPEKIALIGTQKSNDIKNNPFKGIKPFPNWSIKYNGLNKIGHLRDVINNLTLSNRYTSVLSMNSFSSNQFFNDPLGLGFPGFVDSISGNYIPYFMVPNITISEQLSPLIGIDASFTNDLSMSFSYGKSRTLTLSLIDYQVTEVNSTRYTMGAGFRVRDFPLPFNIGSAKKLKNDLNFRFDMSFQDNTTVNNRMDADLLIPTSGSKVVTYSPSIDYVVNNRVNLHFFYNKRATTPFISTSYPMSNTEAGVTIRYVMQ